MTAIGSGHCQPCFERTKRRVPAFKEVAGTPMCKECFVGRESPAALEYVDIASIPGRILPTDPELNELFDFLVAAPLGKVVKGPIPRRWKSRKDTNKFGSLLGGAMRRRARRKKWIFKVRVRVSDGVVYLWKEPSK